MAAFKIGNPGCCCGGGAPTPVPCLPCALPKSDLVWTFWTLSTLPTPTWFLGSGFVLHYTPDALGPGHDAWISACILTPGNPYSHKAKLACYSGSIGWIYESFGLVDPATGEATGRDDCSECARRTDGRTDGAIVLSTTTPVVGQSCGYSYVVQNYEPTWDLAVRTPPGYPNSCSPLSINWRYIQGFSLQNYVNISAA